MKPTPTRGRTGNKTLPGWLIKNGQFRGKRKAATPVCGDAKRTGGQDAAIAFDPLPMLQAVLDHIPQRVFWKDRESRFLGANHAFLGDIGLDSSEQIVGKHVSDLLGDVDVEIHSRHDREVLDEEIPRLDCDERRSLPGNREQWLLMSTVPLRDRAGTVIGTLGCYTDVTQHKIVQFKLQHAIDEMRNLNTVLSQRVEDETAKALHNEHLLMDQARHAAMGEMIGNIAHQWRQPLSTLGLLIQNLRYDFAEGRLGAAELEDYVAKALRAVDQMSTTIDDFRDFFKPDRRPEAYSPVEAIDGCLELVGASLKANNIALAVTGPREFRLLGYPSEFSQILLNLISNAKDAIVERRVAPGRIDVTVAPADGEVVIAVSDNAGGVPEEHLVKIFDPYFTTKDKGTGIGLYMARTIVEQHMRGTIHAENTDEGAMFILSLPLDIAYDGMN